MSKLAFSYLFKTNLSHFRSAIVDDDTDRICRCLDSDRQILSKTIDKRGNTALIFAIQYGSPIVVNLLLAQGADPDQVNYLTHQTPMNVLASKRLDENSLTSKKSIEIAKILLDNGALVDKPSPKEYLDQCDKQFPIKETPLMVAVRKKNVQLAKLLIAYKANVNYIDRTSFIQPIHLAVSNGDETMFDVLDNASPIDCSIVSVGDETLLHWFCHVQENDLSIGLLEKLIRKGCKVNAPNAEQRTPIFFAVMHNMVNTCRILIREKARLNTVDINGHRLIDFAQRNTPCYELIHTAMIRKQSHEPILNRSPHNKPDYLLPKSYKIRRESRPESKASSNSSSPSDLSQNSNHSKSSTNKCQRAPPPNDGLSSFPTVNHENALKSERFWQKIVTKGQSRMTKTQTSRC